MWNRPDEVESPIGGAGPGICAWFLFVQYVCTSVCVVGMYTWIPGVCTGGSTSISGMFGVFQPLLMYRLIT